MTLCSCVDTGLTTLCSCVETGVPRETNPETCKMKYSLWSLILATLYSTQKIFHSEFQIQKTTTQVLSVYRKGTFHNTLNV